MRRTGVFGFLVFLALLSGGAPATAVSVLHVPADYPTIGQAIGAAVDGDMVLVAPGTYYETVAIPNRAVTVTSEAGPETTIIHGDRNGPVVIFNAGATPGTVFSGFTVENGSATEGGGVLILNASPTVAGNIIRNNEGCNGGGGIGVGFGSPVIQGNRILNNTQDGCTGGIGGGGISLRGAGAAQVLDNIIAFNTNSARGGGIALFAAGTPTIQGNVLMGNVAGSRGGAIAMLNFSDALIDQNLIVGNSAFYGAGIYWLVPSGDRGPLLVNNTIVGNAGQEGSGIYADGFDAQTRLVNNIVTAPSGQAAVACGALNDANPPVFESNNIYTPQGNPYSGLCVDQTGTNGNISADPVFVSPSTGDFHLRLQSPSIDAGDNTAPNLPATDLDGDARLLDGDGDGLAVVDMGVDEAPAKDALGDTDGDTLPNGTDLDDDGDGCADTAERALDEIQGGMRDPHNFWDFFDTPSAGDIRDRVITVGDIANVVARFGATGDPGIDPRSAPPPAPAYHTAFDRTLAGPNLWNTGPPNGSITTQDIALVVAQFGHSCA